MSGGLSKQEELSCSANQGSYNVSLCSGHSKVVELVLRNNVTHALEWQHGDYDYLVAPSTAM